MPALAVSGIATRRAGTQNGGSMNATSLIARLGNSLIRMLSALLTKLGAPASTPINIRLECVNNNFRTNEHKVIRAK